MQIECLPGNPKQRRRGDGQQGGSAGGNRFGEPQAEAAERGRGGVDFRTQYQRDPVGEEVADDASAGRGEHGKEYHRRHGEIGANGGEAPGRREGAEAAGIGDRQQQPRHSVLAPHQDYPGERSSHRPEQVIRIVQNEGQASQGYVTHEAAAGGCDNTHHEQPEDIQPAPEADLHPGEGERDDAYTVKDADDLGRAEVHARTLRPGEDSWQTWTSRPERRLFVIDCFISIGGIIPANAK